MADKVRRHIFFYGRVQGVGFRWHSANFANSVGLTGWVQNLEDGSVEMEVQGPEEKIDKLIDYMETRNYILIENMEIKSLPLEKNEWDFCERGW